jgi:hypothetical protein
MRENVYYGPALTRIPVSNYMQHFKRSVGFGCRVNTSNFYLRASAKIPPVNVAVNAPDTEIDKLTVTDFTDRGSNKDIPGVARVPLHGQEQLFHPPPNAISANGSGVGGSGGKKRGSNEDGEGGKEGKEEEGIVGDNIKLSGTPAKVAKAAAAVATPPTKASGAAAATKKPRKSSFHRFVAAAD